VKHSFLDRAIGIVSPARQAARMRARLDVQRMQIAASSMSGYEAAKRERAALRNFNARARTADEDVLPGIEDIRARSRHMMMNAPIARGAVNTVVTNVVGTGLRLSAQPDKAGLAATTMATEAQIGAFADAAQREWRLFDRKEHADTNLMLTTREMGELAFRTVMVSGDCFVLIVQGRSGVPFDFTLQLIEADRVCNPNFRSDTDALAGGIEYDAGGTPMAIHVVDLSRTGTGPRSWRRLPMRAPDGSPRVLHLMHRERIGQSRGVPYLAPVMAALKDLDRFSEAELTAAVLNAMIAIVGQSPDGSSPLKAEAEAAGAGAGGATPGLRRTDVGLEPGMILEGFMPGESIESFSSERPSTGFDPFVQAILRQVGAALGIPFELLVLHFTASYSASRGALLMARQFFLARRAWLAREFCQPVYDLVLRNAILRGRIEAPGFLTDPAALDCWTVARWTGPGMGQINPQVEVRAAKEAVEARLASRTRMTAELFGDDWEATETELEWEEERIPARSPAAPPAQLGHNGGPPIEDAPPPREDKPERGDQEDETQDERNAA